MVTIGNMPSTTLHNMETNVKHYSTYCLNILSIDDYRKNI